MRSSKMKNILQGIVGDIHHVHGLWYPTADKVLQAFAYCEPRVVKVIHIKQSIGIFVSLYMRKQASPVSEISLKH